MSHHRIGMIVPSSNVTVETEIPALLARHANVGRAAFARRFREVVGTSPLSYVREHRLDLAERALVTEPDATVAAVARRVGYASPFSFSTAFHRHRGRSPRDVRPPRPAAPAAPDAPAAR